MELYKIQEEGTSGWVDITEPLNKELCKDKYEELLREGINPKRLKIIKVK